MRGARWLYLKDKNLLLLHRSLIKLIISRFSLSAVACASGGGDGSELRENVM